MYLTLGVILYIIYYILYYTIIHILLYLILYYPLLIYLLFFPYLSCRCSIIRIPSLSCWSRKLNSFILYHSNPSQHSFNTCRYLRIHTYRIIPGILILTLRPTDYKLNPLQFYSHLFISFHSIRVGTYIYLFIFLGYHPVLFPTFKVYVSAFGYPYLYYLGFRLVHISRNLFMII